MRHQYVHAIDVLPTLLESIGVRAPDVVAGVTQVPLDGVSFAYTFDAKNAKAPSTQLAKNAKAPATQLASAKTTKPAAGTKLALAGQKTKRA